MNTNILRLIAESQKESINEKKLAKARQHCQMNLKQSGGN